MAAAAAAREQAERERRAALEAAARGRQEKQAHADQGKIDKLKEVERTVNTSSHQLPDTSTNHPIPSHSHPLTNNIETPYHFALIQPYRDPLHILVPKTLHMDPQAYPILVSRIHYIVTYDQIT
ncbi:hypothetical protein RR46_00197 [Papilio xuthus]|uniref:Uncharacterized protein n=1 Tax=Papilio xuthus TaxID=66420 RepID=A0A0N0PAH5_PAPXU|nr:hypothetical protein RR46_00197 [Papilio xuthus]